MSSVRTASTGSHTWWDPRSGFVTERGMLLAALHSARRLRLRTGDVLPALLRLYCSVLLTD